MRSMQALRCALFALLIAATSASAEAPKPPPDATDTTPPHPLPRPVTTEHELRLPGRTLHVVATVGAIRLSDPQSGAPLADIGFKSYRLAGDQTPNRPLVIGINGGPGSASAWLDICALGPWRLPISSSAISPSMPTRVVENADTWLDFTDLLFIDPLGTGYSRPLGNAKDVEKRFYSVNGDIEALATVIRKWLVENRRLDGPKYIVGESYGGFRAPKLAKRLEQVDGVGIAGLVLVSPVLDPGWMIGRNNPLIFAGHLPSLVAAARGLSGTDPRAQLADVEAYAAGSYLVDLYRGLHDASARHRMSQKIAAFTGLDEDFVERRGGRVGFGELRREQLRKLGRIASRFDANVTGDDPHPFAMTSKYEDPILDALKVSVASAMAQMTADKLNWPIDARYEINNKQVSGHWDWGHGLQPDDALGDLNELLALDPRFRTIVMHGVSDQVTAYFTSKMLLDQLPTYGDGSRLRLFVYGGGHMPYLEAQSRIAMREDARRLITGDGGSGQRWAVPRDAGHRPVP